MFTGVSNPRNAKLYLIIALAIMLVVILTFAVVPSIAAPKSAVIPVTGASEYADYYQRHSELRVPGATIVDVTSDFYLRHPEWTGNVLNEVVPVTGLPESPDYYQRHTELRASAEVGIAVDTTDYFVRHPELSKPAEDVDLSDYFLRH